MAAGLSLIRILGQFLSLLVIAHVALGYILPWEHPARRTLDKIVSPLLNPIRGAVRPIGGLDFSPVILILLINALQWLLSAVVRAIFR